jgi:hypothetical protein
MTTVTFVAFAGVGVAFLIHVLVQFHREQNRPRSVPPVLLRTHLGPRTASPRQGTGSSR